MDKGNLGALLERVESATGPDRKLDIAIARKFYSTKAYRISDDGVCEEWSDGHDDSFGISGWFPTFQEILDYTDSIDAAIALAERVLPGWGWGVCHYMASTPTCFLHRPDGVCFMEPASTPALAVIKTILISLISHDDELQQKATAGDEYE